MIYVFKTSVKTKHQVRKLAPHLRKVIAGEKWNFDLDDRDKIFRIDCDQKTIPEITQLLNDHKIHCEELH